MSSASPFGSPDSAPAPSTDRISALAIRPLRFVGFWTGVLAPLAYPPLLFGGLDTGSLVLLIGVVVANVLGLLLGRGYAAEA